jgi:formylglycine-generating enzyme required for sulfatase activity
VQAQRREKRVALAGMGVLLVVAGALFYAAGGVGLLTRGTVGRALDQEIKWVPIPAPAEGKFQMGCVPRDNECLAREGSRHPVGLRRPFEMMAHEVTVAQFRRFSGATGAPVVRWLKPWDVFEDSQPSWSADDHPAVNVSVFEAAAFCAFVGGRLPTEAEWEYAARGGNADAIYPWGNDYSRDQANGFGKGGMDKWKETAPVGSFPANGFGLHDMVGNVWEWTASLLHDYPYRGDDGREDPASREARVGRGGSWTANPRNLRVSFRLNFAPASRNYLVGFRCARDVSP